MKYLFFSIALTCFAACNSSKAPDQKKLAGVISDTAHYTSIQWTDSIIDIGTVKKGKTAIAAFRFKNTGNYPLILQDVRPGCGCTIADYTKTPVEPGNEGMVEATFHSDKANAGAIHKSLIVLTANTKDKKEFVLSFTGNVVEK